MNRTTDDAGGAVGRGPDEAVGCVDRAMRIGDWEVEGATNVVRRGDDTVQLEPKAMEVLCFLAGRPGSVVTRDEPLGALWPGLVVGDDTLTQAVIKLRRAFGDDPRAPRYIETVPKRGYRLIAPVGTPEESSGSLPATPAVATPGGGWLLPVVAVAGAGSMLAVGLWLHRGPDHSTAMDRAVAMPVASVPAPTHDTSRTLVVMPFQALGDHPGQRYLAEGLASELAADLFRMLDVTVVRADAASSGTAEPAEALGGAAFFVLGAVQRMQDRIAVEARLEDAATGHEVWSERYYRPFGDLFEIRDDIEARIASTISARIS